MSLRALAVPSRRCRRAKQLQSTGRRPAHGHVINQPAHEHSACNQATGGHDERFDHRSQHVACCRAFVGEVGRAEHPTARWQDKSREVRGGRVAQERRQIRHFARGATKHDSLQIGATPWKIDTTCTSRAMASCTRSHLMHRLERRCRTAACPSRLAPCATGSAGLRP